MWNPFKDNKKSQWRQWRHSGIFIINFERFALRFNKET